MANDNVNQLMGPIELAMKIFLEQEDKIPRQIVGETQQKRRQLINGQDTAPAIEEVVRGFMGGQGGTITG